MPMWCDRFGLGPFDPQQDPEAQIVDREERERERNKEDRSLATIYLPFAFVGVCAEWYRIFEHFFGAGR